MAMTSIALTDEQLARLRRHAESSGLSLDEVVREAVDTYLTHLPTDSGEGDRMKQRNDLPSQQQEPGTVRQPFSPEAQAEIDAALARIRATVPADLTPEEIDAEIDAAWLEVRQERRARRGRHD